MKRILITGVSRPSGIGATLAGRFAEEGYEVLFMAQVSTIKICDIKMQDRKQLCLMISSD
ncbi:hypothetical protein [Macrococcus brunensis]|uniref:hypothetical protein n=1 Tax=Macrococcus brunensis TaxID=198483 RepID=UPI00140B9D21|nr:hypothetical protein [Macrococcus brunensis]